MAEREYEIAEESINIYLIDNEPVTPEEIKALIDSRAWALLSRLMRDSHAAAATVRDSLNTPDNARSFACGNAAAFDHVLRLPEWVHSNLVRLTENGRFNKWQK
jgi:hypothetical protein